MDYIKEQIDLENRITVVERGNPDNSLHKERSLQEEMNDGENQALNFQSNDPIENMSLEKEDIGSMKLYPDRNGDKEGPKTKNILRTKIKEVLCESCHEITEQPKTLKCYICKQIKCRNCGEKETHYSTKKRDQSSYICINCFDSQNAKIR